jgi:hypothetical protein
MYSWTRNLSPYDAGEARSPPAVDASGGLRFVPAWQLLVVSHDNDRIDKAIEAIEHLDLERS